MMRTYRVEKLIYGALEATLQSYRFGRAAQEIPVIRMITMTADQVKTRAQSFSRKLRAALPAEAKVQLLAGNSLVGGGSCPEYDIPTTLIALEAGGVSLNTIESRLRRQNPAIILRLEEDKALIDLRTVFAAQEKALIEGLRKAIGGK
jgi:L-seryl-tRNA(Ser) seleniumtransferase